MASRRSTRNPTPTSRFSPQETAPKTKRARVASWKEEPEIPMDLGQASSSFVDSNRIATGTLTEIPSDSLKPGNLYSIWHKYEKTEDITDPMVGVDAGRPGSKDKYYVRFKGTFVGYDRASSPGDQNGISGVTPPLAKLAVFNEVSIISKDKTFFTRDIYMVKKQKIPANIKLGINVYTFRRVLNPMLVAQPPFSTETHARFGSLFNDHIKTGKGMVAFDMEYWSFANDFATEHNKITSERQLAYNNYALNSFVNPADPKLVNTRTAMGEIGPNTLVAEYLGKDTKIPKTIPLAELSSRGETFNPYINSSIDEDGDQKMEEVDGGSKRRKTRRRKMRKNKTRSKRRRSTRSRK